MKQSLLQIVIMLVFMLYFKYMMGPDLEAAMIMDGGDDYDASRYLHKKNKDEEQDEEKEKNNC